MPTFLEYLWSTLYSQDAARRFAAYSSRGIEVADMTAQQRADLFAAAAAFADAGVQGTPCATLALLQAHIVALKP